MDCCKVDHLSLDLLQTNISDATIYDGQDLKLVGFEDVNFARDRERRMQTISYVFSLTNGALSWMSGLQFMVALSTIEVEYIAITYVCKL